MSTPDPHSDSSGSFSSKDPDRAVEIYRAAARIFAEKGYHATSIHEIAGAVHLTKAGLYYYISGKQDLLQGIMQFALDALEREVVAVALEEPDLVRRLRTTVVRHASLILEGRAELSILVNEIEGLTPERQQSIKARQLTYVHFIRDTLAALEEEGRLNPIDTTTAAFGVVGMILWLARWFQPEGRLSQEEVVDGIASLALGGLLVDGDIRSDSSKKGKPTASSRSRKAASKKDPSKKAPSKSAAKKAQTRT